jgi:hypothetical protein
MPPKKAVKKKSTTKSTSVYQPINFYELEDVKKLMPKSINPEYKNHKIGLFFNGLLIGASGSGKTNSLLNLIMMFKNTFNHIYIFTKTEEALYDHLLNKLPNDMITIKYGYKAFLDFDEKNFYGQSLVIFDDMVAEKNQSAINEHFIRGRKLSNTKGGGCCSLYLSQSYFAVPTLIRNQCDLIIVIKVPSLTNMYRIMKEYSLGETKEQIKKMYNYACVDNKFGDFLLLDMKQTRDKVYRKNYDEYLFEGFIKN